MSNQCGCQSGEACSCQEDQCDCGGSCGCGGHATHEVERRVRTRAEHIADMEAYLTALKAEAHAVEEHLVGLRQLTS